jgi:hypothetical protein
MYKMQHDSVSEYWYKHIIFLVGHIHFTIKYKWKHLSKWLESHDPVRLSCDSVENHVIIIIIMPQYSCCIVNYGEGEIDIKSMSKFLMVNIFLIILIIILQFVFRFGHFSVKSCGFACFFVENIGLTSLHGHLLSWCHFILGISKLCLVTLMKQPL